MEPPAKRIRRDGGDTLISRTIDAYIHSMTTEPTKLKAVLSNDFTDPIPLTKVYVGLVRNLKDLSRVISILNEKIPLKELQHLKRVRKREVVLCPSHCLNGMSSIQEYLECNVEELKDFFEYFKEIDVPLLLPKVKKQYNRQLWSCNFHPNKYYERLVSDNFFDTDETKLHTTFMEMAFDIARWYLTRQNPDMSPDFFLHVNVTVVVDPSINSVVATSFYGNGHPVQHASMLAIDNVARTQNGGAWDSAEYSKADVLLSGIPDDLLIYLKETFPDSKFGARTYNSKMKAASLNDPSKSIDNSGPYLCTGYDVYMIKEPCLMCAMALVHARVKRIFFSLNNLEFGALKSKMKLQAVPSLNHHFEVFTGFL